MSLSFAAIGFVFLLLALLLPTPAHAQPLQDEVDNGNCISCHEDLYFLHDTGNYFCIRESPMRCVDCHGGDPAATTQESAHFDRSAHPVVNEDISKCQECHVNEDECCECVSKFDRLAGFKQVKLVSPAAPSSALNQTTGMPVFGEQQTGKQLFTVRSLPLFVIASLALTIYIFHKVRHS